MSEGRHRTYYDPRVLLYVPDVLETTFPDSVVCLTGQQAAMLRSLCEYLHRPTTWVAEYQTDGYLVPDDDTWDEILGIVAECEEMLMGCTEFTALMEQLLAAIETCCEATDGTHGSPITGELYRQYYEDDTLTNYDQSPPLTTEVDAEACAIAVCTYQFMYEFVTEWIQPAERGAQDLFLAMLLGELVLIFGAPAIFIPGTLIYELVNGLVDAWVDASLENVVNEMLAYKDELVCACYTALADGATFGEASDAVDLVIAEMDLAPGDRYMIGLFWESWAYWVFQRMYQAENPWVTARLDPDLCASCGEYGLFWSFNWVCPPCPPEGYIWGGACCNGRIGTNIDLGGIRLGPYWYVNTAGTVDVVFDSYHTSCKPLNWGVGEWYLVYSATGGDPYTTTWPGQASPVWGGLAQHASYPDPSHDVTEVEDVHLAVGWYCIQYSGPSYHDVCPYPYELIDLTITTKAPD